MTSARTRIGTLALACALGALGLVGCTSEPSGPPVVVLFPGSTGDSWGSSAEVLRAELADDGYDVEVRLAGDDIPAQLTQLREALADAPAVIVIAPVDATAVAAELAAVDDPEVALVSYDRLVLDAPEVDYFATFDHREAGRLQARALLEGLGLTDPASDAGAGLAVELLAGSGDDPAAQAAYAGALEVLQPYFSSGTLVVPSGRVDLEQAAVLRASPDTAAERIAELLAEDVDLAGVLSPTDAMSAAVAEVLAAVEPEPEPAEPAAVVLTGGGSTLDGARAVVAGTQTATVYEDPRELARAVASMVREVVRGSEPGITRGATTDNGAREVPTLLLEPRLLTRLEAEALLAG